MKILLVFAVFAVMYFGSLEMIDIKQQLAASANTELT